NGDRNWSRILVFGGAGKGRTKSRSTTCHESWCCKNVSTSTSRPASASAFLFLTSWYVISQDSPGCVLFSSMRSFDGSYRLSKAFCQYPSKKTSCSQTIFLPG